MTTGRLMLLLGLLVTTLFRFAPISRQIAAQMMTTPSSHCDPIATSPHNPITPSACNPITPSHPISPSPCDPSLSDDDYMSCDDPDDDVEGDDNEEDEVVRASTYFGGRVRSYFRARSAITRSQRRIRISLNLKDDDARALLTPVDAARPSSVSEWAIAFMKTASKMMIWFPVFIALRTWRSVCASLMRIYGPVVIEEITTMKIVLQTAVGAFLAPLLLSETRAVWLDVVLGAGRLICRRKRLSFSLFVFCILMAVYIRTLRRVFRKGRTLTFEVAIDL